MNRLALLFLLMVVPGSLLIAQNVTPDTQTGNFLYKMPAGWKPMAKGDTTVIHAPSLPQGKVAYIALAAARMDGDLEKSFHALWGGFKNSYRVLQGGNTAPLHARNGYDALYTSAVVADHNGQRWNVYVMGAQYKNQIQTVMFMSNLPQGTRLSACQKVFQQTFLASLSFGEAIPGSKIAR